MPWPQYILGTALGCLIVLAVLHFINKRHLL